LLDGWTMADFGLPDVQSLSDLDALIQFCRNVGVMYVVYSMAKIALPRQGKLPPVMERMKRVYEHLSPAEPLPFRGGAWRLPATSPRGMSFVPFWTSATSGTPSNRDRARRI
jgi:hypothetical protein